MVYIGNIGGGAWRAGVWAQERESEDGVAHAALLRPWMRLAAVSLAAFSPTVPTSLPGSLRTVSSDQPSDFSAVEPSFGFSASGWRKQEKQLTMRNMQSEKSFASERKPPLPPLCAQ